MEVSKNIISSASFCAGWVCSGSHEDHIEKDPDGRCPLPVEIVPVVPVQFLWSPKAESPKDLGRLWGVRWMTCGGQGGHVVGPWRPEIVSRRVENKKKILRRWARKPREHRHYIAHDCLQHENFNLSPMDAANLFHESERSLCKQQAKKKDNQALTYWTAAARVNFARHAKG